MEEISCVFDGIEFHTLIKYNSLDVFRSTSIYGEMSYYKNQKSEKGQLL